VDANAQKDFRDQNPAFAVVWATLGTDREDGPKLSPTKIVLGGKDYNISNVRTLNRRHQLYFMFDIRNQNPIRGLPIDLMTGNLTATEPEKRHHLPVKIVFNRLEDNSTLVGVGRIEQSTQLSMEAVAQEMTAPVAP
jgi:hypothetical protein